MPQFSDRGDAGRQLALALGPLRGREIVVVGLARGGMIVAEEVARSFGAPLEVVTLKDIGAPLNHETPLAAVAPDASFVDNDEVRRLGVTQRFLSHALVRGTWEVRGRDLLYHGRRPRVSLAEKTVLLVDDGEATGPAVRAAIASVRRQQPREVYVGMPVCGPSHPEIGVRADGVVCLAKALAGQRVAEWYRDFPVVTDEEVIAALHPEPHDSARDRPVTAP